MSSVTSVQKPKTKQQRQAHARNVLRQIISEPFEIAKTAGQQVSGGEWATQTSVQKPQTGEQPAFPKQEEVIKKQKRDSRHYQAFQTELQEIKKIQKQREQERLQLRMQEEQKKQAQIEQAKKQDTLIEPVTKKVRGMLGGAMGAVKKKQTQVEMQKTPSN